MGLPKDIASKATRPLRRQALPTAQEVLTGRDAHAAPKLNDAQLAGIDAVAAASAIDSRRKIRDYEARKAAEAKVRKTHQDAVWQDYLERSGRA